MATAQLHLSDEWNEEHCPNSTESCLRPCSGALLIVEPSGRRRLVAAHRGARKCSDGRCRTRYRSKVFALALAGIEEALGKGVEKIKMLTLTLPSSVIVPIEWVTFGPHWRAELSGRTGEAAPNSPQAYRYMAERFNRFQTAARRLWRYEYLRVVEEGSAEPYRDDNGNVRIGSERVHYHLLVMSRQYMAQRKLSELAATAGLGVIVDIRAKRNKTKAAGYLAAYAAKDGGLVVPSRMRFFVMSRGWAKARRTKVAEEVRARRDARRKARWSVTYVTDETARLLVATDPDVETCAPPRAMSGSTRLVDHSVRSMGHKVISRRQRSALATARSPRTVAASPVSNRDTAD